MRLFDDSLGKDNNLIANEAITSPVSAPRLNVRSRIFNIGFRTDENRRVSAPGAASNILAYAEQGVEQRKRKRTTNINPFTPTSLMATLRKKARMTSGESNQNR